MSTTTKKDGYTIAHRDELERTGNWTLVRRSLGCRSFGVNLVEIPRENWSFGGGVMSYPPPD